MNERPQNKWLHRFALFLSGYTLLLLMAGASVTSTGSGLAVPDWPLSFGQFFPEMKGGVLFEHGHRMIAGGVLLLTVFLLIWLFGKEPRAWVRRLGLVAMLSVILQAILGGMTVLLKLPTAVSVSHAGLAQIYFCMTVTIALVTSPKWEDTSQQLKENAGAALRKLTVVTTGLIYAQILIGALVRHSGAGLAIPDFPLSYGHIIPPFFSHPILIHFMHRVGALVVAVAIITVFVRTIRHHRDDSRFMTPASWLLGLLVVQILLGAVTIWSHRAPVPTTLHVAVGATVLGVSLVMTLRAYRYSTSRASEASKASGASPSTGHARMREAH